jgi:hypothetical protein
MIKLIKTKKLADKAAWTNLGGIFWGILGQF